MSEIDYRVLPVATSTNDEVVALAARGADEGLWVRAVVQTGGRGRRGKAWSGGAGNLHISTLVRLRSGDPMAATLALVTSVSLHDILTAYAPAADLTVKWPNDVMLAGEKISGILLEKSGQAVVVGIGVNLACHPADLDRPVTSLPRAGFAPPDPDVFGHDLAVAFARWLGRWRGEGLEPIRRRWLEIAHPSGTPLAVQGTSGDRLEGLFDGLEPDGALRLRLADGSRHVMHAGDVFLL